MKLLITAIALAFAALSAPTFAASHAAAAPMAEKKPTEQQSKMATCNKDAGEKKGDERKAFMKSCLSAKADGRTAQQEKMKACNASAADKKGDARKAHMKECLSKKA